MDWLGIEESTKVLFGLEGIEQNWRGLRGNNFTS